jgi:hypothetical protein
MEVVVAILFGSRWCGGAEAAPRDSAESQTMKPKPSREANAPRARGARCPQYQSLGFDARRLRRVSGLNLEVKCVHRRVKPG